jgi:hypothetical protein
VQPIKKVTDEKFNNQEFEIKLDSANWLDNSNRSIPLAFSIVNDKISNQQLVIISHG